MHDTVEIVGYSKSGGFLFVILHEIVLSATSNIFEFDFHKLIAIVSGVLMKESQGMHEFMNGGSYSPHTAGWL